MFLLARHPCTCRYEGHLAQTDTYRGTSPTTKRTPPRILQYDSAQGSVVVLEGWRFLNSEVPLSCLHKKDTYTRGAPG